MGFNHMNAQNDDATKLTPLDNTSFDFNHSNQAKIDRHYMLHALKLANHAFGHVSPNPYVGAIIVKNGQIIGEGYHHKAGEPHAEINALNNAKQRGFDPIDAQIYVTLEPCNHTGRTGACTLALIHANIREVIYATQDPNPLVAGNGHLTLSAAGITVRSGICEDEARFINRIFIHQQQIKRLSGRQRPYVILKTAMSLDGKMATQDFDAKWITTEPARQKAHEFRQQCDAILIGRGTLLADNPSLTVRNINSNLSSELLETSTQTYPIKQPVRVVLLSDFKNISIEFNLFNTNTAPTWIMYPESVAIPEELSQALANRNVRLIALPPHATSQHPLDPHDVLEALSKAGIQSVLIEGGARIHNAFLNSDFVNPCIDEFALFYGACLIGHRAAPSLWDQSPVHALIDAPRIQIIESKLLGQNIFVHGLRLPS